MAQDNKDREPASQHDLSGEAAAAEEFFAGRQGLDRETARSRIDESGAEDQIERAMREADKAGAAHPQDETPPASRSGPRPRRRIETDPALNDPDATPGTGMLPPIGDDDPNMQPSS